jgi:hypothetical protein
MIPTVLLTLGRLPKALDLARGFARLGWRVVVAEPMARHLCGASRDVDRAIAVPAPVAGKAAYLEALAAVVRRERVSLVLPVSEETLHVAHLPPRLPHGVRVFTMPPEQLLPLHAKDGFVAFAERIGLDVPRSARLDDPAARGIVADGPVVVKPIRSCAGRGLLRLSAGATLPAPNPAAPALVQRLVMGREYSTCSLVQGGQVRATAIYRGTMFAGSVAVCFERVEHPAIEAWVTRFAAAAGWTGFLSFDLIEEASTGTVFGIECNPRTTSGLHFLEAADVARAVVDAAALPPRFVAAPALQQFWSCLTETQLALLRGGPFRAHLRRLLGTKDVTWQARDPWPLLSMPWTAWPILRAAAARRVPFGEVAMEDVGWFEGEVPAEAALPARATP